MTRRFFRRRSPPSSTSPTCARGPTRWRSSSRRPTAAYGLDPGRVVALGYSNGANIAASLLLRRRRTLRGAALLRPMLPYEPEEGLRLDGTSALVAAGARDPLIPLGEPERLARLLAAAGAEVALRVAEAGHDLAPSDLADAAAWLAPLTEDRTGAT